LEKGEVRRGKEPGSLVTICRGRKAVTRKGLPAAHLEEKRIVLAPQMLQEEEIVITLKGNHSSVGFLQRQDGRYNLFGVKPSVNIVTQKDKRIRSVQNFLQQQRQ
jgi:hypothetical protein